jgi:hypothetical protein
MQALLAGEGDPALAEDQELDITQVRFLSFSTHVIECWLPSFFNSFWIEEAL